MFEKLVAKTELHTVQRAMRREIEQFPPTVGLGGVSGVGKSFTLNRMFKTTLATSDTIACTTAFTTHEIAMTLKQGDLKEHPALFRIVDAPGLGEDIHMDPHYLDMYKANLPRCDVILWVMAARNRAVALDQIYLKELLPVIKEKVVFGINQVDLLEPMDWTDVNLPSKIQRENIDIITHDRTNKLTSILGFQPVIIPYSAKKYYNLDALFATIIEKCPPERAWIFYGLKNFNTYDFIPVELREHFLCTKDVQEAR